jgi:hypothetical protein
MPDTAANSPNVVNACVAALRRWRIPRPGLRRQREYARIAFTELDIRRLDNKIDDLLDVLAQLCDYSGQPDVAQDLRAMAGQPVPSEPRLRLVPGQP